MAGPDVRVVGISGLNHNYPELIARALGEHGFNCEASSIPFLPANSFTPPMLRKLQAELRQAPRPVVTIYCSGAEIYLPGPHISVYFSAYQSWFRPQQMRVIAHPWTSAEPASVDGLKWTNKPPLTVGFMGTAYSNSRVGQMVSKSPVKRWVLSGRHLRSPGLRAVLNAARVPLRYAMTFPRAETLKAIEIHADATGMDVRIVDTGGFTGSPEQVAQYDRQMRELTYVLCPRGLENYSFRLYEALKFGRIPVLVDTETVLPEGVNWDELIVRVPYAQLADIGHFIARDYERHSGAYFRKRQEKALEVMSKLCAGGWAEGLANDVRRQLAQKRSPSATSFSPVLSM